MNLRVSWPNSGHFLLGGARVELEVDGVTVAVTMIAAGAEATLPAAAASPSTAVLSVVFQPSIAGTGGNVLQVEQTFALAAAAEGPVAPRPTVYKIRRPTGGDIVQTGKHPLLRSSVNGLGSSWQVMVSTDIVDVSTVQPLLLNIPKELRTSGPTARLRMLVRTDKKKPLHYICATPPICDSAPFTDVLCFLTAPGDTPPDPDVKDGLTNLKKVLTLAARVLAFFGTPIHDNTKPPIARDHFSPASPIPHFVLLRRWEEALMASGRHVSLVLPVPADGSHNTAGSGELPAQLAQVHAVLASLGDIAAPAGSQPGTPLLGLAAHSYAGAFLFKAVKESAKSSFAEVWLFEAMTAAQNVDTLARAVVPQVLFVGYEKSSVEEALAAAEANPALSGHVSRLPDPPPPAEASPEFLAKSSPLFTHMLEGIVTPATAWKPANPFKLPNGEIVSERFQALHQLIVQGNDADKDHFLTKALKRSLFR